MKLSRAVVIILAVATALPIGAQEQPPAPDAPAPPETLVLPTERVIDFETDEVTWMSVDVSPDGRTLRLRPARRPLHAADRRRHRHAHRRRHVVREPADVGARRPRHRLPQRSQRGREPVDRRRRRRQPAGHQQGPAHRRSPADHGLAGVDARRPVPGRVEVAAARSGHVLALHVPPRRRQRRPRRGSPAAAAGSGCHRPTAASAAQPHGRGGLTRWPVHLLRAALRRIHLQHALPAVADLPPRPRHRRRLAGDQRTGQRDAAAALARRQVAGLRHPSQGRHRAAHPQPRDRRGALARLAGDPRRPGIARLARHAAALRLPARRAIDRRPGGREAAAHRRRHRAGDADSVHRPRAGRGRGSRLHAGADRRRAHGAGAAGALAAAVA